MNLEMNNRVYQGLKKFIKEHDKFSTVVLKRPSGEVFPKVVFTVITNKTLTVNDPHSFLGYEVSIYTKDLEYEGELLDSMEVAEILQGIVATYMENCMSFKRLMANPTPNIDSNVYCITMQYVTTISDTRCCFF